jgi:hypothetical protein
LWGGRDYDAKKLSTQMPKELIKKLNIKKSNFIDNIYFESGIGINKHKQALDITNINNNKTVFNQYDLTGNTYYSQIGLNHNITPKVSIYESFTYLTIDKLRQILFYDSINYHNLNNNYTLKQIEYYIKGDILIKYGLILTPAFHFLNISYKTKTWQSINIDPYSYEFVPIYNIVDTSFNNYVYSLTLSKDIKNFKLSVFGVYSELNNYKQIETGTSITWFPKGNLNYYTTTTLTNHMQKDISNFIVDQTIGMKVFPKLWIEAFLTYGNMVNFTEKNGYLVYNMPDEMKTKTGIALIFPLNNKIELSLRLQEVIKKYNYPYFENSNLTKYVYNNYQNNLIIGGLKWQI